MKGARKNVPFAIPQQVAAGHEPSFLKAENRSIDVNCRSLTSRDDASYSPFKGHSVQRCSLGGRGNSCAVYELMRSTLARLLKREWVVTSTTSLE